MKSEEDVIKKEATPNYGCAADIPNNKELDLNEIYELIGLGPAQYIYWAALVVASSSAYSELSILSVILPSLRCEWDLSSDFEAAITISAFASFAVCSAIFGRVADQYGRKPVLVWTNVLLTVVTVISAVSPNKWLFLVTRLATGALAGTGLNPLVCYGVEFAQNKYRAHGNVISLMGALGGLATVHSMAWWFLETVGWRWFMVIVSLPVILSAIILFILLPGSPRFLSVSGQQEKAMQAIRYMAKLNRVHLAENIRVKCYANERLGSYSEVLTPSHRRSTLALSMMFFSIIFIQFGLIIYLPLLFSSDYCGSEARLPTHSCVDLTKQDLLKLTVTSVTSLGGTVLALVLATRIGRLLPTRVGSAALVLTIAALFVCVNQSVTFAATVAVKTVAGFINTMNWIIIPESFPTNIRSTAIGFINAVGKFGGALGTGCVYLIFFVNPQALVGVFFVASVIGFIGAFLYNRETKDIVLQET